MHLMDFYARDESMEQEEKNRLFNRIDVMRDEALCARMDSVYGSLSTEDLNFLWHRRGDLRLGPLELELLRNHTRRVNSIQIPPPPSRVSHDGTVDWWSKPRNE